MKTKICPVLILCLIYSCTLFPSEFNYQFDFNSSYIWRGRDLNPSKKPVVQPSMTYTLGNTGIALNIWCSFSFENSETNELDLTLSYDFQFSENVNLTAGFVNYGWYFIKDFKFNQNTTQEFYLSMGFPNTILSPSISIFYDINNGSGLYIKGSIGHELSISEYFSIELFAAAGYNNYQWTDQKGFSDLNFGTSVPFYFEKFIFSISANYTKVLNDFGNAEYFWVGTSFLF